MMERISAGLTAVSLADPNVIKAAIEVAAGEPIPAHIHCVEYEEPQQRALLEHSHWDDWLTKLMYEGRTLLTPNTMEKRWQELKQAADALRPSLNANAHAVLNWMLAQIGQTDNRSQVQLAKDIGITKGAVTKIRDRNAELLEFWCEKRRRGNFDAF